MQEDRNRETNRDDRKSEMEPAEGSRANTNVGGPSELPPESFGERGSDEGGGISNRPIGEEQERQDNVPPRGERRDERHNEDVER
jgi:hypothetical protein